MTCGESEAQGSHPLGPITRRKLTQGLQSLGLGAFDIRRYPVATS
jgi:hypothetical protein